MAWAFYLVMLLAMCLFEIAVFGVDGLAIHESLSLAFVLQQKTNHRVLILQSQIR